MVAVRFATRAPLPVPRVINVGDLTYVPDQRPMGCAIVLLFVAGATFGATAPQIIHEIFFIGPEVRWPPAGLDGLGRLAQVVGGVCGAYVGARAVLLWIMIFLAWVALYMLSGLVRYIALGP